MVLLYKCGFPLHYDEPVAWSCDLDLQAHVVIHNPVHNSVAGGAARFAHWVNVPMVPGGTNQLTDNTEFIIPTQHVNVSKRWQSNLGMACKSIWSATSF